MSRDELQQILARLVAKPVAVIITDNSHAMITVRWSSPGYTVRIHHMFLEAGAPVLKALAGFIGKRSGRPSAILRDFVAARTDQIRKAPGRMRRIAVRTVGRYFDLEDIFGRVNREYFNGQVDCRITWGTRTRARPRHSIRLGTYSEQTKTIRVHPHLDQGFVPPYVVEGIVYHEMLHHLLGTTPVKGRKVAHSPVFRRLECRYPYHGQVQAWIKAHRDRLLRR
jgi:hypothetical protein